MDLSRIDEVEELLEEIVEDIPEKYFNHLNGGIVLEEEVMYHPQDINKTMLVLGLYKMDVTGRQIAIFYGSFMEMFGFLPREALKEELRKTLYHELTHHLEFLAGNYDLVEEDRRDIEKFLKAEMRWKWRRY